MHHITPAFINDWCTTIAATAPDTAAAAAAAVRRVTLSTDIHIIPAQPTAPRPNDDDDDDNDDDDAKKQASPPVAVVQLRSLSSDQLYQLYGVPLLAHGARSVTIVPLSKYWVA